jgi:hypothetical protein
MLGFYKIKIFACTNRPGLNGSSPKLVSLRMFRDTVIRDKHIRSVPTRKLGRAANSEHSVRGGDLE